MACVAGGIIVPGVLSWRRTCHSKWVKGESPSLTCSQSSRGFAAKKLQHSRLNRQLRKLRRVWVSVLFFVPIPSVSSLHKSPLYEFGAPCMVIILEYEQSLLFNKSVEQNARETQMSVRINEGARQERHVSRLFSCVSRARALPSLNPKKKRDCSQFIIIRNQGNFAFGIPNLAKKKSGILLPLTEKMLLNKRKTNPETRYL